MKLGAFSVSLAVKDLETSKKFYEDLGFSQFAGAMEHKYLIMKNGETVIGLFEGMFVGNLLTFNPGWDQNAQPLDDFEDVRDIQKTVEAKGIKLDRKADLDSSGPTSFVITDPDGNVILFDQHV